ncbi:hypothetical protein SAMN05421869_12746 [Nonomuraea jiangxiensis]|uniref:Uncharacterized protein n=1 Tax=Nonomuraea jiangxiensis TaxID=633440 RepID=A0A1G9L0Z6_9ACTN|nr:hypothetical protein SAMN05421869_12746 [Nonomuraea jiangxiensis]
MEGVGMAGHRTGFWGLWVLVEGLLWITLG